MNDEIIRGLKAIVGDRAATDDPTELLVYECDALALFKNAPDVVVFPENTEQVAAVVRLANEYGVPFVPRGAGTGLSGGSLAAEGGIIIELQQMNRILEIDAENRTAVLQPGVVNLHVSEAVAPYGLYYAPDPSSQVACTIGGNVAENAGGPHCLKYGMTTNHILEVEAVLSDGRIVRLGTKSGERVGYDLLGVSVGSEGTFLIVTEITVRLLGKPQAVETMLAAFPSIEQTSQAVSDIIARGVMPAALEFVDRRTTEAVEASVYAAGYPLDAAACLLIELDGFQAGMEPAARAVEETCRENGATEIRVARSAEERTRLWRGRKGAFGAMGRISPDMITMDAVIPRTRLPEVLVEIERLSGEFDLPVANVFHAGDGNLHPLILFDSRDPDQVERIHGLGEAIMDVCVRAGGALSGEHGIGVEKKEFMCMIFNDDDLEMMKRVRDVFNPRGLLNPGKVFPSRSSCTEVGYGVTSTTEAARRIERYVLGARESENP